MAAALSVLVVADQSQLGAEIWSSVLGVAAGGWAFFRLNAHKWIRHFLSKAND